MPDPSIPDRLPPSLYRYFWDTDASLVNPREHPAYVINRLLDKGNIEAARWVLRVYPKATIKKTLRTVRDFSPWNGRFWASYMNLSEMEVACLQPSYLRQRRQLWPY